MIPRNCSLASKLGQGDEFEEGKPVITNSFEQPLEGEQAEVILISFEPGKTSHG
jgi:hypothetical protein